MTNLITTPGLTIPRENIAYAEWLREGGEYLYIYLKVTTEKSHIFLGGDKSFAFWEQYTGQRVSWDTRPKADSVVLTNLESGMILTDAYGNEFYVGRDGHTLYPNFNKAPADEE